jgi:glycine/D-amino acid oxidase-like deaminating enzyme
MWPRFQHLAECEASLLLCGLAEQMNELAVARGLRDALVRLGVRIYEGTPAVEIGARRVRTVHGEVRAPLVFACLDRFAPELGVARNEAYHQQNFIIVSEPLSDEIKRSMFPDGPLIVTDAHSVYHYFRLTPQGRLVAGGGLASEAYRRQLASAEKGGSYLADFIRGKFPVLEGVNFTHCWPGKMGVSRDLLPLAGPVPVEGGKIHVAMCGAGMAWSVLAAETAAQFAVEGEAPLARFFALQRPCTPLDSLLWPLPKPTRFELSHLYAKTLLRGSPEEVGRQQQWVKLGATVLGMVAAGWLASRWRRRR